MGLGRGSTAKLSTPIRSLRRKPCSRSLLNVQPVADGTIPITVHADFRFGTWTMSWLPSAWISTDRPWVVPRSWPVRVSLGLTLRLEYEF